MALFAIIRPRRPGRQHGGLPRGTRVGCSAFECPHFASARSAFGAFVCSSGRRGADDHRVRASRAAAQQGCGSRSARVACCRCAASPRSTAPCDQTEPGIERAKVEGEATPWRRKRLTSSTSRFVASVFPATAHDLESSAGELPKRGVGKKGSRQGSTDAGEVTLIAEEQVHGFVPGVKLLLELMQ